jgi:hypothetical protein
MSLKEAKDPSTSAIRLVKLSQKKAPKILAALAQNPSTPLDTLLVLAQTYPEAFLANPVLQMFLLEDPTFLHRCSEEALHALLGSKECPGWAIRSLVLHPNVLVRRKVAENNNTSIALLEALAIDKDTTKDNNVRLGVVRNERTPLALLEDLATDKNRVVRREANKRVSRKAVERKKTMGH